MKRTGIHEEHQLHRIGILANTASIESERAWDEVFRYGRNDPGEEARGAKEHLKDLKLKMGRMGGLKILEKSIE